MKTLRLGLGAVAIALAGTLLTPPVGSAGQEILRAEISPRTITPTGTPVISSIDVCNRGASSPQINTVVTGPDGVVVIDQWHLVNTAEPGVVVDTDGNWSVELQLRDEAGQPTGEPFPALGTYTVHVDCVTTYHPQVRIPYNDLTFEVVDSTATTTPTDVAPPTSAPPSSDAASEPDPASVAIPVRQEPEYAG